MRNIAIVNMSPDLVLGVSVMLQDDKNIYKERFFQWQESTLTAEFGSNKITGGVLRSWKHTPIFDEIETHIDREMFYFVSGTAIMLFIDINEGKPNMSSAQLVRILPGTQIIIDAGKGHFVAVAEDDVPVQIIVVSPKMEAPRISLPDYITGS